MSRKTATRVERTKQTPLPTKAIYSTFQEAYSFFNRELFDGSLRDNVLIVLSRKANSRGHFGANRFSGRRADTKLHELSLNPDHFPGRTDEQICSTMVHEMVHCWQYEHGTPSRRGYHNAEWARAMKAVGLYPSSTGGVGGMETGGNVSHYIVTGGPFEIAYAKLAAKGFVLDWQSASLPTQSKPKSSKVKFTCGLCGQNAWGKPDLAILCKPCRHEMAAADGTKPNSTDDLELAA
jgi:hypothetical protein